MTAGKRCFRCGATKPSWFNWIKDPANKRSGVVFCSLRCAAGKPRSFRDKIKSKSL